MNEYAQAGGKRAPVKANVGCQLSISVQNERGILASIARCLGKAGVNIHALTLTGGIDHGYVRMVTSDPARARHALMRDGHLVFERDVILLEIENVPGALAEVAEKWAGHGVNLEYAYCAGGPAVERGLVILRVDDTVKALEALREES